MAQSMREQALSLISTAKNHNDLSVKLSSLKQVKEILRLSVDHRCSIVSDVFPYIVDLHTAKESLVRKFVVELMEKIDVNVMEQSSLYVHVLLGLLKDDVSFVVKQTIISSTSFFCTVLRQMALQFHQTSKVERLCEEIWLLMIKLRDAIHRITLEPGSNGTRLLAIKFLETHILLLTLDVNDYEASHQAGNDQSSNVSWMIKGHPILDPALLTLEAKRSLNLLLDFMQSANSLSGSLIIAVVNCLAAIGRKRPFHYGSIISLLLGFDPNLEAIKGGHTASIQYSLRTAFLGFLRCIHPAIIESRDRLIRALITMNAEDAAGQVIRKVDKLIKNNDRISRDARLNKEDLLSSDDLNRKRPLYQVEGDLPNFDEAPYKKPRYQIANDSVQDDVSSNGFSLSKGSLMDSDLTPVEQMIAMIGALIAEGERGANSLEVLISNIHPDLMADIVITNMKHLLKSVSSITSRPGIIPPVASPAASSTTITGASAKATSFTPTTNLQPLVFQSQVASLIPSALKVDISSDLPHFPQDSKRDPRRDPRRLDPRRLPVVAELQSLQWKEDDGNMRSGFDGSTCLSSPSLTSGIKKVEDVSIPLTLKKETGLLECSLFSTDQLDRRENMKDLEDDRAIDPIKEDNSSSGIVHSPIHVDDQNPITSTMDIVGTINFSHLSDSEYSSREPVIICPFEDKSYNLPLVPVHIELAEDVQNNVRKAAVGRVIDLGKQIQATGYTQTRMALLARLVAQIDSDGNIAVMLEKHTLSTYKNQKGHELAMYILYYLHTATISGFHDVSSSYADTYEKFLLAVAMSLRDRLPASDKSFSRFLGDVPLLPASALMLLEDLCYAKGFDSGKGTFDTDRITQGLGAVWSLILNRPLNREACLNIVFKCAVHVQEDVRARAIRLVVNKLYSENSFSDKIERFATETMLSAVDPQQPPEAQSFQAGSTEQSSGRNEESISGSQNSEPGTSEDESIRSVLQSDRLVSFSQAQQCMSLYFALCTKKPSLLQLVFDTYGRAPKTVKQAVHRHIPNLVKSMGSSYSELLHIIANPPLGSENLLLLVIQILTEEKTPSRDLIATVKHLYETKLQDAAILIPMLSLLPKDEVLPIFPRLVDLPLEKFQIALARILQGSAHTGPALTPAEVLVVIHDIIPEKDRIALKKVTEACSACFEQRTVFTEQVLAKALNQLVDRTPLPLLFMRTVIQAIDAYPTLVGFVMEILLKLVSRQIWKMPKLWVGFLKCASQTRPHSFGVLLKLPPPQLESALNKHNNLRSPLAAHASQPSVRSSLPRAILVVLGLAHESNAQQRPLPNSLHTSDTSSSFQGAMLT